jgi:hypothetical protein
MLGSAPFAQPFASILNHRGAAGRALIVLIDLRRNVRAQFGVSRNPSLHRAGN